MFLDLISIANSEKCRWNKGRGVFLSSHCPFKLRKYIFFSWMRYFCGYSDYNVFKSKLIDPQLIQNKCTMNKAKMELLLNVVHPTKIVFSKQSTTHEHGWMLGGLFKIKKRPRMFV